MAMFKVHPLGTRVVLKLREAETRKGAIVLTKETVESDQRAETLAEVVEIGPLAWKDQGDGTPWCKVGDLVTIQRYVGARIVDPCTGKWIREIVLVNDVDLLAVIPKESYEAHVAEYEEKQEAEAKRIAALKSQY